MLFVDMLRSFSLFRVRVPSWMPVGFWAVLLLFVPLAAPGQVLSTGGGAFMSERNRRLISQHGVSVWLKADLKLLWNRVKHKDTRPLLRSADPYATLRALYEARVPIYAKSDLCVQAQPAYSIDTMVGHVIDALKGRPDILEECE